MDDRLKLEAEAFDNQIEERVANGYIPDLRFCEKTEYFYNNEWRDPAYVKMSFGETFELIRDAIQGAGFGAGSKVLEVGCGPGFLSLELARAGFEVSGIDVSSACIKVAEKFAAQDPFIEERGSLHYITGDFFEIFEKYDAIVFLGALHHFANVDDVLNKCNDILNNSGVMLVHEPTRDRMTLNNAVFIYFMRTLLSAGGNFYKSYPLPTSKEDFEKEIEASYKEYKYEEEDGSKKQSINDNESGFAEMVPALRAAFEEIDFREGHAFFHETIGGLRLSSDEQNHKMAAFLKAFDYYMCQEGILQSLEFFFVGRKK